ncbi:MAG: hypothetical protein WCC03_07690 [Candidatus Acidiferrales bacterium]
MAQETVVKEQLTQWAIFSGYSLTQQLLDTDFELVCSFWLYTSEPNEWRLIVSSPRVETEGTLESYERIRHIIRAADSSFNWSSYAITVLRPDAPVVRAIRSLGSFRLSEIADTMRQTPAPKRVDLANLAGVFIEDAYIYFVR